MQTTQFPKEVTDALQDAEGNFEVSNIQSKRLFDLCQKLAQNANSRKINANSSWFEQTSEVKMLRNFNEGDEKLKVSNNASSNNNECGYIIPIIKQRSSFYNSNTFVQNFHLDLKPRKHKSKKFKSKYSWMKAKIKKIIENYKMNKRRLFTFNPSKIRVKSPPIPRVRRLIEENGFNKVYKVRHIINL